MPYTLVDFEFKPFTTTLAEVDAWIAWVENRIRSEPHDAGLHDALASARRERALIIERDAGE